METSGWRCGWQWPGEGGEGPFLRLSSPTACVYHGVPSSVHPHTCCPHEKHMSAPHVHSDVATAPNSCHHQGKQWRAPDAGGTTGLDPAP